MDMTRTKAAHRAVLAGTLAALASCAVPSPAVIPDEGLTRLEAPKYEKQIIDWARTFFAEPSSLRSARISAPVPYGFGPGNRAWLVCVEYDGRGRGGDYMGVQRLAFGFGAGTFYPPLARSGYEVSNHDCDTLALAWRPFPQLERLR